MRPNNKTCLSQISTYWLIRLIDFVLNSSIYLTFTVAMIAKMATTIGILESPVHLEKSSILFAGTGVRKNSTLALGPDILKSIILLTPNGLSTE